MNGNTKKVPVYVCAQWESWNKAYTFKAWPMDMSSTDCVLIETTEVEVTVPPESVLHAGTVAAYRAEQQRIRAEAEAKVSSIEQAIKEMQCLEYTKESQ